MQHSKESEGRPTCGAEKTILLLSIGFLVIGSVGYFSFQRDSWIFYFLAHMGALGVMGLSGSAAGFLARKKCRSVPVALSLGFLLPIVAGILAVLVFLWGVNGQLYCGGSVSLLIAVLVIIGYLFAKRKAPLHTELAG